MGTSYSSGTQNYVLRDHPHAYGDKTAGISYGFIRPGSSPRVWGQACAIAVNIVVTRIIPTRMGTRNSADICQKITKDHPHAYGDKTRPNPIATRTIGSSPRVWGQVRAKPGKKHTDRIIPTRMGTSKAYRQLRLFGQDHPHAYGDKGSSSDTSFFIVGSSPRVWGQEKESD